MAATPVTPTIGQNTIVTTGGTAVQVFPGVINGGTITNPIGAAGVLYVDPVATAGTTASGSTFALQPGQPWSAIPGQTTPTTVNAADDGHAFTAVYW